jgi:hypothetical protein
MDLPDRRRRDVRRSGQPELDCSSTAASPRISSPFRHRVSVGTLQVAGISALGLAQDIVVTGHGGDHVRFLVFPNIAACRAIRACPTAQNEVIGTTVR